jgi:peptide/nickel transport system permease protein
MAVFAPVITLYPPQKITGDSLEAPGPVHVLGTDELGMDYLVTDMLWCKNEPYNRPCSSIYFWFWRGAIGILAGYIGGHIDQGLMRIIDVTMALPSFPLLI